MYIYIILILTASSDSFAVKTRGHLIHTSLGGGFKYFLFSPLFGEGFQFDYIIFFKWVETTN